MVERKKIGDIMTIVRGSSPRPIKNYLTNDDNGVNWIKIGDVAPGAKFVTFSNEKITKEGAEKSRFLHSGDFILSNSMSFGRPYILQIDGCIHDGWIAMSNYEKYVSSAYLYEILNSKCVQDYWKMKANNGGAMTNLNSDIVKDTVIPIPSISEQTRIVGMLDTFSSSIENMKQQITERRKQYEYYREQLLDLEGKDGVELISLDNICDIKGRIGFRGYTREDQVKRGEGAISLSPGNITNNIIDYDSCTYITWEKYEESPEIMVYEGEIILCKTASVGKVAIVSNLPEKATINPQLVVLKDVKINPKFLFYLLSSHKTQPVLKGLAGVGSVPNISQKKLGNVKLTVPSTEEQSRVVSILVTFEESIQNLEAQLKEREKQYEYYRNQLLTFK